MKDEKRTRVAVLGASGFIGRSLCSELLRRGHEVIAVSRAAPGIDGARWARTSDYSNLQELDAPICVHLAEPSSLQDDNAATANRERAMRALAGPFRRIVYLSTAGVYGDRTSTPRSESDPIVATSKYIRAKLAIEDLMTTDPRTAIVRLSNTYGPGMSANNVMSELLGQLASDGPLRLRDLGPVRDYVHITDAARAIADLAMSDITGPVNVGTGVGTSVGTLARWAVATIGQPDRAIVATEPSDTESALVLDTTRARRELGWLPLVTIEDGFGKLIREQLA